jgi:D-alanine-D-alanine ligase
MNNKLQSTILDYSKFSKDSNDDSNKDLPHLLRKHGSNIENFILPENQEQATIIAAIGKGLSAEHEVSLSSSSGIVKSLVELGYYVIFIDMGRDIAKTLEIIKPDIVFNALHGTYGEDGALPGLLNIMQIPYTGSGILSSSIAFNKKLSYRILKQSNIKLADMKLVTKSDNLKSDPMNRPYVIKPISQGSSLGVEVIFKEDDFNFSEYDFPYGDEIMVEEFIKGREMQGAVLNGKALGCLEIELLKNKRFYDYEVKYTEGFSNHLLPAPLSEENYNKILKLSEKISSIFNSSGMVRVEFIFDESKNEFYCLELNTHPGMTPISICPEIATLHDMTYTDIVEQMVKDADYEE